MTWNLKEELRRCCQQGLVTRQDGTTWTDLTFVFAYYENGEQRFEDSALVSTFDTNIMAKIAPYIVRGAEGKERWYGERRGEDERATHSLQMRIQS